MINLKPTWNQRAFTTLLKRNNGITQTVLNITVKMGLIHDHTNFPINESVPNIKPRSLFIQGKSPYSNSIILSKNIPPFNILHCMILLVTFDSLKNYCHLKQQTVSLEKLTHISLSF